MARGDPRAVARPVLQVLSFPTPLYSPRVLPEWHTANGIRTFSTFAECAQNLTLSRPGPNTVPGRPTWIPGSVRLVRDSSYRPAWANTTLGSRRRHSSCPAPPRPSTQTRAPPPTGPSPTPLVARSHSLTMVGSRTPQEPTRTSRTRSLPEEAGFSRIGRSTSRGPSEPSSVSAPVPAPAPAPARARRTQSLTMVGSSTIREFTGVPRDRFVASGFSRESLQGRRFTSSTSRWPTDPVPIPGQPRVIRSRSLTTVGSGASRVPPRESRISIEAAGFPAPPLRAGLPTSRRLPTAVSLARAPAPAPAPVMAYSPKPCGSTAEVFGGDLDDFPAGDQSSCSSERSYSPVRPRRLSAFSEDGEEEGRIPVLRVGPAMPLPHLQPLKAE
eukprot:RCo046861